MIANKIKKIAENILGRPLVKEDGVSIHEIKNIENKLELELPTVLVEFYSTIGNLDIFMSSFEYFPEPYLIEDKIVFLEENQGVCFWGISKNKEDYEKQTVYVCTDIEVENIEWHSENINLSDFLEIIMYYQCAQGGYECGSAVYECNFANREKYTLFLANLVTGWRKVVSHNGLVIYQKEGKLIWHFTDDKGNLGDTIFASTRTNTEVEELEPYGFREL